MSEFHVRDVAATGLFFVIASSDGVLAWVCYIVLIDVVYLGKAPGVTVCSATAHLTPTQWLLSLYLVRAACVQW